jgi:Mediator complex subunit MED14
MFSTANAGATGTNSASDAPPPPRRMDLTLHPEDGSLQTVSLYQVLLAATDALYSDLFNMAHGELDVYTTTATAKNPKQLLAQPSDVETTAGSTLEDEESSPELQSIVPTSLQHKKERMTNLSFAQRRHELLWRLSQNARRLQQVAALTAAAASTPLGATVDVCCRAVQHTRTAWVQADEAQDALYFFHAQLFPARRAPHDVYGAADVLRHGRWYDLPSELLLCTDRYQGSMEQSWSKGETDQRWQLMVRDKLVSGEVGWRRRQQLLQHSASSYVPPLWKISLQGGIVKFTVGQPKVVASVGGSNAAPKQYPIEAWLTVFPAPQTNNAWTLLSVQVTVRAKTGEFHHQLEMSHRQRYDLHRIAATAMRRAEAQWQKRQESGTDAEPADHAKEEDDASPSQPLHALFQVTHRCLLSWQLELLSAQAQALRRGVWAANAPIAVSPVRFSEQGDGVMSISFWKVDDAYGPPSMGDLNPQGQWSSDSAAAVTSESKNPAVRRHASTLGVPATSQLTVSIRAEANSGIIVALSGGASMMFATGPHRRLIESNIENLIEAATNPVALSASDVLLAATNLCAEFKCRAVVQALQPTSADPSILPTWISLSMERGCISVAASTRYHGIRNDLVHGSGKSILFQLICDARTGSFVVTFPRGAQLLRQLAGHDSRASAPMALRMASLPVNRRRAAGSNSTGRVVREAFDSLVRSMNLLGQRVGVGGFWDDVDDMSSSLRQRAIQSACLDVKVALISCCGMAVLYGVAPLAFGTALGLSAVPDL